MADITDPQAVRFCNEKIRPAADRLAQAYNFAVQVIAEWNAHGGTALIPNEAGDSVVDGSATDGRPPIVGSDASNIVNRLSEIVTDFEATGAVKLNTILSVSPQPGV